MCKSLCVQKRLCVKVSVCESYTKDTMQTIVLYLQYIVLILLFSSAYTSLIYCLVIQCLNTNNRRPCYSTLSGHPSSSCLIETRNCKGSDNTTISSTQSYCKLFRITNLGKVKIIRAFTLSGSHSKQFRICRI